MTPRTHSHLARDLDSAAAALRLIVADHVRASYWTDVALAHAVVEQLLPLLHEAARRLDP